MPRTDLNPLNLGSIARGAALELFDKAIRQVADNIADKTTDATAPREIVLRFRFEPDEDRRSAIVTTSCSVKTAAVSEHASKAYFGKDPEGRSYAFDQDPRQDVLFEPPPIDNKLLEFGQSQK